MEERLQGPAGAGFLLDLDVAERFHVHRGGAVEVMAAMAQERLGTRPP